MKLLRITLCALLVLLAGCGGGSSDQPIVWRLVDNFDKEMVKNVPTQVTRPEPAGLWVFGETPDEPPEDAPATLGWKVATAVSSLRVEDGRLQGRATTGFPIIYVERDEGLDTSDLLHAVEVRMRVDRGSNLSVESHGASDLDVERILDRAKGLSQPWNLNARLIAGKNIETYTLRPPAGTGASGRMVSAGRGATARHGA